MSRPMLPICAALLLGIVSAKETGEMPILILLISSGTALAAGIVLFTATPKGIRRTAFMTIWLMLPGCTWLGFQRTVEVDRQTPLKEMLVQPTDVVVRGTVDFISLRQDGYAITLADSKAQIGQLSYKADKLIISADFDSDSDLHIGDRLCASGKLYPCEPATNPGQFDSETYYRIRRIDARLYAGAIVTARGSGLKYHVNDALYQLRKRITEGIYNVLPEKEAGTLTAILTGDRGMLDEDVKALYSEGGIAHILSISSLHVSLLGMGLFRLLMRLVQRLRPSVVITVIVMLLYGAMTGFSVSTCRAIIMLTVSLVGKLLWRGYDLPSSIGFSAFVLLVNQPNLIYDSGFKLSFLAVLGIYAAIRIADVKEIENEILKSLLLSGFVQIFTLPVLMETYYSINPYSIVVNIIVLPLMSVLLVAGFTAGGIGCVGPVTVGRVIAGPVYYILRLYEILCEVEEVLPYSKVITGAPKKVFVWTYYALVTVAWVMCVRRRTGELKKEAKKEKAKKEVRKEVSRKVKSYRTGAAVTVCLTVAFTCLFLHRLGRTKLYCAFLDVGQGDCIYVEADGLKMMVDSGSTSVKNVGKYRVEPFLKWRGVTRLDRVVISHPDTDHVSAVLEMIQDGYPEIGELVVGGNLGENENVVTTAENAGIPVRRVTAGDELPFINVLSPVANIIYEDANSASVVLELLYGDFSMLLTGDSDFAAEELYRDYLSRSSYSVLKCAHHGSKYSTSIDTLKMVRPVVTVVSCSKFNTYGHPNPDLLYRLEIMGSEVFTTPDCGMVSAEYVRGDKEVLFKSFKSH